jgi:predicted RNA-binding protein with PIN domain
MQGADERHSVEAKDWSEVPRTDHSERRAKRWLVDGMNVIGSRPDRWWNDPDRAVRRFIDELVGYAEATGDDVVVVFDRRPPDATPGAHGPIEVVFASRRGRNAADHDIAELVAEDEAPATITVVTSDRALADRVKQRGAQVASAGSFRRRLDGRLSG